MDRELYDLIVNAVGQELTDKFFNKVKESVKKNPKTFAQKIKMALNFI